MECDLCGKPATAKARVEGAMFSVCAQCARHGTDVKQIIVPTKKEKKTLEAPPKEELVETIRPDFAKILRAYREKLTLNQEQFAAKLQIRASVYNHYESGSTAPDISTARKFEHEIGVPFVVHVKVVVPITKTEDHTRGMMAGDFIKKKSK